MVAKLRHMIFGAKSEKIILRLEQLEFELEEHETAQAEAEAFAERMLPEKNRRPALNGGRSLNILNVRWSPTLRPPTAARIAAASYVTSVRMSPNNSSTCPRTSRLSGMCGRSSPAAAAIAWLKRRRLRDLLIADWPARACLPM